MTDWKTAKAGDEVEIPFYGKVKLTRPVQRHAWRENSWIAPGYRWIKSKQKFSGNALENQFKYCEDK